MMGSMQQTRSLVHDPHAAFIAAAGALLRMWGRAAALSLMFLCAAPAAAGEPSVFTLELIALTIPADPQAPMEVIGPETGELVTRRRSQQARVWSGVREVRFDGLSLTLDSDSLLWNGESDPPAGSGIRQLIHRQLHLHAGQPTQIRALVDDLQYFEMVEGGLFKLKSVSKKDLPGLLLKCKAIETRENQGADRLIRFDYDLRLVVVEGREQLPGAPDQLGKPRLARFKLKRSEEIPAATWHLVSGHLVSETGAKQRAYFLVLIRISPVEE